MTTSLAVVVAAFFLNASAQAGDRPTFAAGTCMKLGQSIVSEQPARAAGKVAPKKTVHVAPQFPPLPTGTSVSGGAWVGEALVDSTGRVAQVWPVRQFQLEPAFPSFNQAVVDAIQQWRFAPLIVSRRATPVCMTVTSLINLQ